MTPQDIQPILDPLNVPKSVKADAWDAYHAAQSPEDFQSRFDKLALPKEVKATLWDAKFSNKAAPPQPTDLGNQALAQYGLSAKPPAAPFMRPSHMQHYNDSVISRAIGVPLSDEERGQLQGAAVQRMSEGPLGNTSLIAQPAQATRQYIQKQQQNPNMPPWYKVGVAAPAQAGVNFIEGMTTPATMATLGAAKMLGAATPIARTIQRGAQYYFGGQMAKGAAEGTKQAYDLAQQGDYQGAVQALTSAGFDAAMAADMVNGIVKGRAGTIEDLKSAVPEAISSAMPEGVRAVAASKLRDSAVQQYERVINPTTKQNKNITSKIVPQLLDRGVIAASPEGLAKKATANAGDAGAKVGEIWDSLPETTKAEVSPILDHLNAYKAGFQNRVEITPQEAAQISSKNPAEVDAITSPDGAEKFYRVINVDPDAVSAINQLQDMVAKHGDSISAVNLRKVRDIFEKKVAKAGGFAGIIPSEGSKIDAADELGKIAREQISKFDPNMRKANQEYSFWKDVERVAKATAERRVGQQGGLKKIAYGAAGAMVGSAAGPHGTVAGLEAGKIMSRIGSSPFLNTTSAVLKNKLANVISPRKGAVPFARGSQPELPPSEPPTLPPVSEPPQLPPAPQVRAPEPPVPPVSPSVESPVKSEPVQQTPVSVKPEQAPEVNKPVRNIDVNTISVDEASKLHQQAIDSGDKYEIAAAAAMHQEALNREAATKRTSSVVDNPANQSLSAAEALKDLHRTYGVTESFVKSEIDKSGVQFQNIMDTSVSRNGLVVNVQDPVTGSSFAIKVDEALNADSLKAAIERKRNDFAHPPAEQRALPLEGEVAKPESPSPKSQGVVAKGEEAAPKFSPASFDSQVGEAKAMGYEVKFVNKTPTKWAAKHFSDRKVIEVYTKGRTPEQIKSSLNHEIGHVVDYQRRGIVADPMGDSVRDYSGNLVPMADHNIYFRMGPMVEEAKAIRREIPRKDGAANTQKEIFADAYRLYKDNPAKLREIAPTISKELESFLAESKKESPRKAPTIEEAKAAFASSSKPVSGDTPKTSSPPFARKGVEDSVMSKAERDAEIERIKTEKKKVLSTPLASEGGVSPAQMGMMSKGKMSQWQKAAQERLQTESRIKELQKSDTQLAQEHQAVIDKENEGRIAQLQRRISDFENVGVGANGKIRPKYAKAIAEAKAELAAIQQPSSSKPVSGATPKSAGAPFARKGVEGDAPLAEVRIHDSSTLGAHHGQTDNVIYATTGKEQRVQGKLEYSIYGGTIHINHIEVVPELRRQGIARKMWEKLKEENPDMKIEPGYATDEGSKFLKAVEGKTPTTFKKALSGKPKK